MGMFQENLKRIRSERGFKSAKQFAAALGIGYTRYINYENKGREPDFETLCKIADALHVTTDELLGFDMNPDAKMDASLEKLGFRILNREDGKIELWRQTTDGITKKIESFIFETPEILRKLIEEAHESFYQPTRETFKNYLVSYFYRARATNRDGIFIKQGEIR